MKKNKQIGAIALIVILVVAVLFFSVKFLVGNGATAETGPIYATMPVTMGDIDVGVRTKGQLQPTYGGGIRVPGGYSYGAPQVNYTVQELLVEEGDEVSEGQLLIKLVSNELETSLESKKDKYEALIEELAEITGKDKSEVLSINPAKGVVLTSPISGRISGLNAEIGDKLTIGHIVTSIVDDSQFKLKAKLQTGDLKYVKAGSKVKMKFPYFDGYIDGVVESINSSPIPADGSGDDFSGNFVYLAYIVGDNPGLVQQNMKCLVGVPTEDNQVKMFAEKATVDGFMDEEKIINKVEAIVTDVHVFDFESIEAGAPIVSLSGEEMQDTIREKLEELRELQSEISDLRSQFDNLEIYSTMNGVVSYLETKVGESVSQGRWLGDIYNTGKMMLNVQVDDIDIINVRQGAIVNVTVDAVPGEKFEGKVTNVSSRGNTSGGVTKFDVFIEVTGGAGLRPGMQGTAYIDAGHADNVLLIPIEAVFEENGEEMVEILVEGIPQLVKVELGLMNDRHAEVVSGLEVDQLVITGGTSDLLPSEHIKADDSFIPDTGNDDNSENE